MQRLLIAAVTAAFLATAAAPVLADDYPPCTSPGQDHCRVTSHYKASSKRHHSSHHHHHHHSHGSTAQKKPT
jgi:hypothetical protein